MLKSSVISQTFQTSFCEIVEIFSETLVEIHVFYLCLLSLSQDQRRKSNLSPSIYCCLGETIEMLKYHVSSRVSGVNNVLNCFDSERQATKVCNIK